MSDPRHGVPQTVQSLPSLGAIFLWVTGKNLEWWAALLGLLFIAIQIGYVTWKWARDIKRERERVQASRFLQDDDE